MGQEQEQIDILETPRRTQVEVEGLSQLEEALSDEEEAFYWVTLYAEVEIKVNALAPKYAIEDALRALDIALDNLHEKVDHVDNAEVVESQAVLITTEA